MIAAFAASKPPRVVAGSPEWRAALFGQVIAYAGHLTGEICPYALGSHLRRFLGQAEEACDGETVDAVAMLVETGLFSINTIDHATGAITFVEGTKLTAGPMLTEYLYGEPDGMEVSA